MNNNIQMSDHFEFNLVLERLNSGGVNYRYNDLTDLQIQAIEYAVNSHDKLVAELNRINQKLKEVGPIRLQLEKAKDDVLFLHMTIDKFRAVNTQLKDEQMQIIAALGTYHTEGESLADEVQQFKTMVEERY